jgi:hypothetical protein
MIVTGPARDGTRLGLIDVGVPRLHLYEGGSSAHGPPFLLAVGKAAGLKTGATRPFAGVSPGSKWGLKKCATGIVRRFHLSKPPVRN